MNYETSQTPQVQSKSIYLSFHMDLFNSVGVVVISPGHPLVVTELNHILDDEADTSRRLFHLDDLIQLVEVHVRVNPMLLTNIRSGTNEVLACFAFGKYEFYIFMC